MRRAEQVVVALAVLEPEDPVAVVGPAAGRLVGLARQQRRELQLLGADRVHLLADDLLDLLVDPQAQRQPGVDAGRRATDVARAHQQPVARHLGVHGVLAQGPHEQLRHPQDHWRKASRGGSAPREVVSHSACVRRVLVEPPHAAAPRVVGSTIDALATARHAMLGDTAGSLLGICRRTRGRASRRWPSSWSHRIGPEAVVVPMDGFHLHDDELARLGLGDRKGAPETFDVEGYVALLRQAADGDRPTRSRRRRSTGPGSCRWPARSAYDRSTGWSSPRATTCCTTDRGWSDGPAAARRGVVRRGRTRPPVSSGWWSGTWRTASPSTSPGAGPLESDQANADLVAGTRDRADLVVRRVGLRSASRRPERSTDHRQLQRQPGQRRGLERLCRSVCSASPAILMLAG